MQHIKREISVVLDFRHKKNFPSTALHEWEDDTSTHNFSRKTTRDT
jgi:hypothetical protein